MYLRALPTALCRFQCAYRANNYARLQRCRFKTHLESLYSTNVYRNFRSQNLKLLTNSWIQRLKEENVPEAELSVKFITEHVLGKERTQLCDVKEDGHNLMKEEAESLNKLCLQRLQRVPVQYVIGEWDFRYLNLEMRPPVFIPRPETEELVQLVARHHCLANNKDQQFSFLEVGCGSGAICLSILSEFPQTTCVAIDKSKDAVGLTRDNANRCSVSDRMLLYHTDVRSVLPILASAKFDAVISNPPYIPERDMAYLQPEISRHEDVGALYGGRDGLDVVKEILRISSGILKPHGSVWLEVDISHPEKINDWISSQHLGLIYCRTFDDFTQRPRFCHIMRNDDPLRDV